MLDDELARVMRSVGLELGAKRMDLTGGASGSGVYRVQIDGDAAVLKVTPAGEWQNNARRELTFYQTLADQVPVTTPSLLRYADNDHFTALLLSAHGSARPAREWDRPAWLEVARQLAAIHSIPPPGEDPWIDPPVHRKLPYLPPIDVAEAYWPTTGAADSVRPLLDEPDQLVEALRAIPDCFGHGDCHVDNLLREGEQIVWADWQVAGVGCPASELAFLWSRANADGAELPYEAMLREYVAHREVDPALFHRALVAAEIEILLFAWPHFAASLTQEERDRLTRRLLQLIHDWSTT
ncbi:aminoglycoside phosphotransferase family protein [Actinopolymorpha sp. B17G11]|uniref:aminoglycoside phosphotransferase family protein n=1 Tax=Actinopolymorpha sp. B17G11 TaxID=3160861 RepID=UPI0032E371F3